MDRRHFIISLTGLTLMAAPALAQSGPPANVQTPEQIVRWIYAEAVKKDPNGGQNGGTIFGGAKGPIRRLFSAGFLREWDAAQKRIAVSGDMGLDFDPVSNSQDPSIGKTEVKLESSSADKATAAATFWSREQPTAKPQTVRYDFVLEGKSWKLDNIRGSVESDTWNFREIMTEWK